ncbi:hypothetical protein [Yaniella halotolerans]|uniref:hypothetical protein n=1 Tax=Yaniella halotolerans TaxID=225453 RepID=UPI0012EBB0BC|nr:hypothetical protein [Yaniella halotolerans]
MSEHTAMTGTATGFKWRQGVVLIELYIQFFRQISSKSSSTSSYLAIAQRFQGRIATI